MSEKPEFLKRELESPLISAAGLINGTSPEGIVRDVETLAATAIGGITVGSWTIERRAGNEEEFGGPVTHYDSGEMVNALGLPNIGIKEGEQAVRDILDAAGEKPVFFSASPAETVGRQDPVDQAMELVYRLFRADAEIVELNVSCPNVVTSSGQRKPIMGHDPDSMRRLGKLLNRHPDAEVFAQRLGIKLPPYISLEEMRARHQVADILLDMPIAFLTVCNTVPGRCPLGEDKRPILSVPGGFGGGSGPTHGGTGKLQLASWRAETADRLPIISVMGVENGRDIAERQELGAFAVGVNTALWQSNNWPETVTKMLSEYAEYCD